MRTNIKKYIIWIIVIILVLSVIILNKSINEKLKVFSDPILIRNWILSFGKLSVFAFILLQMLQVVIFFIPGELIQLAGGYCFGTFGGTILSLIGIIFGAVITFFIGRRLGEKLLKKIIPRKEYGKFEKIINKPKNKLILFVLYLIPGVPKDILGYISGITTIRVMEFLVISSIARIPGILMSAYFGAKLYHKNYILLIVLLIIIIPLGIVLIYKKDSILNYFKE